MQYINLKHYEIKVYEDIIEMLLKKGIFNNNIHELIKEMDPLTRCYRYLDYNNKLPIKEFTKEKYELELCEYDDEYSYKDEEKTRTKKRHYIKCSSEDIRYESSYAINMWLLEGK